jgi:hypothetical protein
MFKYILLFLLLSKPVLGQQFFRMKADFSIKENLASGESVLTMGTVYFDNNNKKIVFELKFPDKITQIITDTSYYEIIDGKVTKTAKAYNMFLFSPFYLALASKLNNYGLDNSGLFKLTDVEKEDSLVISTWSPAFKKIANLTGDVMISQKKKQLFGLVFFDKNKKIVSKQFFDKYSNSQGLLFPEEIVQVNYIKDKEYYKVTTYTNVVVNSTSENEIYNYHIPVH